MPEVTTYYLEMHSPRELNAKENARGLVVMEAEEKQFQFNRFLYQFVGRSWQWVDKLSWADEQWRAWAESSKVRTWVAYHRGAPAGYFELEAQQDGDVEIAYFGLAPAFIGRGFGGFLLTKAIQSAWAWNGTKRVWVHTCNLDHPIALENYEARGFKLYCRETEVGE